MLIVDQAALRALPSFKSATNYITDSDSDSYLDDNPRKKAIAAPKRGARVRERCGIPTDAMRAILMEYAPEKKRSAPNASKVNSLSDRMVRQRFYRYHFDEYFSYNASTDKYSMKPGTPVAKIAKRYQSLLHDKGVKERKVRKAEQELEKARDDYDKSVRSFLSFMEQYPWIEDLQDVKVEVAKEDTAMSFINKLGNKLWASRPAGTPIYGECTIDSMKTQVEILIKHKALKEDSTLMEFGCGLSKMSHLCTQMVGNTSIGIETVPTTTYVAANTTKMMIKAAEKSPDLFRPHFRVGYDLVDIMDIERCPSIVDVVHIFAQGMPFDVLEHSAKIIINSSCKWVMASKEMDEFLSPYMSNVKEFKTSKHGSGETNTWALYQRKDCARRACETKRPNKATSLLEEKVKALKKYSDEEYLDSIDAVIKQCAEVMSKKREPSMMK